MKLIIDIPEQIYSHTQEYKVGGFNQENDTKLFMAIKNSTPLEEIPNPCIECSQNCCVRELNGEKCECQKVYVVKENEE